MKNLAVFQHVSINLTHAPCFSHFCVDPVSYDIFGYHEMSLYKVTFQTSKIEQVSKVELCSHSIEEYALIGINFNPVSREICLAMKVGHIINFSCFSNEVEFVGYVERGIKTMEWSPDQEMLVLVTGKDSVITMTRTFDAVNEIDFQDDSFGGQQFVTVGWGKKETQFTGSEHKAITMSHEEGIVPTDIDDNTPRVRWSGDGKMFCVSMLKHTTSSRQIKIFNREGVLQYTSEYTPGLESSLAWRPAGNLIASTQTLQNKHQVIFFEKNGLRHGEFTLPFHLHEVHIPFMAWNLDSTILALCCQYKTTGRWFLQLWSVNNYHWYQKQNIMFEENISVVQVLWDVEVSMRLHVVCEGVEYSRYDFCWIIDHSHISSENDSAYVAVIDGERLLLTAFQKSVIPPPMCDESLTLPAAISRIIFCPVSTQEKFCVIMCDGTLGFFTKPESEHYLVAVSAIFWDTAESSNPYMDHWLWLDDTHLLTTYCRGHTSMLVDITLDPVFKPEVRRTRGLDGSVVSLVRKQDAQQALIQLSDGRLLGYDLAAGSLQPLEKSLPEPCPLLMTCLVDDTEAILGLNSRGCLYSLTSEKKNPVELATGITSIFALPEYLLVTTSRHYLQCIWLKNRKCLESIGSDSVERRIERGSQIVVAVGTRVVLQMPRGNLETITPRTLVLHVAGHLLDAAKYCSAFELYRKHRINLNLLFDHDPENFLANVASFVDDIRNPECLSLFLSELSSEDTTETMYYGVYKDRPRKQTYSNKVTLVCDKVREALKSRDDASLYLFPILTSCVRKNTPEDLGMALKEAQQAKNVSVDEALKYLFYMVDVNEMYNIALGMYDFDLVTLVASKSSKDPKEYLTFLNELRRMEPNYQRYSIDKYLMRYDSALNHIAKCPEHFQECMELIKNHKLYSKALNLFEKPSDYYQKVASAYAEHLMSENRWHEAAIMYEHSKQLVKAIVGYQKNLDWQEVLTVMSHLEWSERQKTQLCKDLVADLVAERRFEAAAQILISHLHDVEECVAVLSQGRHWLEAIRIACWNKRLDLLETHVKPGILDHKDYVTHQLKTAHLNFLADKARLAAIREKRKKHLPVDDDGDQENDDQGVVDLYSDTSSMVASTAKSSRVNSKFSVCSTRSSKNRRKIERKKLILKEGSLHEDLALIQSLHQKITLCFGLRDEVVTLCKVLLRFSRNSEATALQSLTDTVLSTMKQSFDEIWTADMYMQPDMMFGPEATSNNAFSNLAIRAASVQDLQLLEPQYRYPPMVPAHSEWKLQILEKS